MPLNNNNFLRFEGIFLPPAFTIDSSPVDEATLFANSESVDCFPLSLLSASNGIDNDSFEVVSINDFSSGTSIGDVIQLASPPEWDEDLVTLTTFRPLNLAITAYIVQFTYTDFLGNISSNCLQIVNVSPVYVSWVQYPTSVACVLDSFGLKTGYKMWSQLKLINSSSGADIIPLTLKDNSQGDVDYYPPVQDYTLCPPAGAGTGNYAPLVITNDSKNASNPANYITINNIFLSSTTMGPGGTPLTLNIPCDIPPGKSVRFMLPASSIGFTYDGGITINYLVTGDMVAASPLRYWKQNNAGVVTGFGPGGSGLTSNVVDNSGVIALGSTFDLLLTGTVIFAQ